MKIKYIMHKSKQMRKMGTGLIGCGLAVLLASCGSGSRGYEIIDPLVGEPAKVVQDQNKKKGK